MIQTVWNNVIVNEIGKKLKIGKAETVFRDDMGQIYPDDDDNLFERGLEFFADDMNKDPSLCSILDEAVWTW